MHRNTYINSSKLLDETYNLKDVNGKRTNLYFAGQITGVEGYVESISSGMVASLNAIEQFKNDFLNKGKNYQNMESEEKRYSIESRNQKKQLKNNFP